jgi:glycopeptide antibiotics resistance protein
VEFVLISLRNKNIREYMAANSKSDRLTYSLFFIYLVILFWIIVLKLSVRFTYMGQQRSMNLIPYNQPLMLNGKADLGEIILNALVFVPMGVYVAILFKRWSAIKSILFFALSSFVLEIIQYITALGAFDITDIINNTLGGTFGLFLFKILEKLSGNSQKAQKIVNIVALLGTIAFFSLFLYLKINKLLMFRR